MTSVDDEPGSLRLAHAWWLVAGALFLRHYLVVVACAVNIPYWDDWDAVLPGRLSEGLNLPWVFSFHNAHRNVWTHLSIWVMYRLTDWNLTAHIAINFLMYVATAVGALWALQKRFCVALGALALFPASSVGDEVHLHAFNNCWTFFILFFFVAVALAQRTDRWAWLAPAAALASVYSTGSGWFCGAAYTAYAVTLAVLRPAQRAAYALHAAICAVGLGVWFIGMPPATDPTTAPWTLAYWSHFLNIIGLGLGYRELNVVPGAVLLTAAAGLVAARCWALRGSPAEERVSWLSLVALMAGLLGGVAAISYGRGWAGPGGAKSGRYAITVLFVIPVIWIFARHELRRLGRWKLAEPAAVAFLLALLLVPLWRQSQFDYYPTYTALQARRLEGMECMRLGRGAFCPSINPYGPESAMVFEQRAEELHLSYLRDLGPR